MSDAVRRNEVQAFGLREIPLMRSEIPPQLLFPIGPVKGGVKYNLRLR